VTLRFLSMNGGQVRYATAVEKVQEKLYDGGNNMIVESLLITYSIIILFFGLILYAVHNSKEELYE